jgi:hypothetical protein
LGRQIKIEEARKKANVYKKSSVSSEHIIEIPLEQFLLDKSEVESYK